MKQVMSSRSASTRLGAVALLVLLAALVPGVPPARAQGTVGPIVFATAVDANNQPVNPGRHFDSGTVWALYGTFAYQNVSAGVSHRITWLKDGQVWTQSPESAWNQQGVGTWYSSTWDPEGKPLADGTYTLILYFAGTEVIRDSARIGTPGSGPTPPVSEPTPSPPPGAPDAPGLCTGANRQAVESWLMEIEALEAQYPILGENEAGWETSPNWRSETNMTLMRTNATNAQYIVDGLVLMDPPQVAKPAHDAFVSGWRAEHHFWSMNFAYTELVRWVKTIQESGEPAGTDLIIDVAEVEANLHEARRSRDTAWNTVFTALEELQHACGEHGSGGTVPSPTARATSPTPTWVPANTIPPAPGIWTPVPTPPS